MQLGYIFITKLELKSSILMTQVWYIQHWTQNTGLFKSESIQFHKGSHIIEFVCNSVQWSCDFNENTQIGIDVFFHAWIEKPFGI